MIFPLYYALSYPSSPSHCETSLIITLTLPEKLPAKALCSNLSQCLARSTNRHSALSSPVPSISSTFTFTFAKLLAKHSCSSFETCFARSENCHGLLGSVIASISSSSKAELSVEVLLEEEETNLTSWWLANTLCSCQDFCFASLMPYHCDVSVVVCGVSRL